MTEELHLIIHLLSEIQKLFDKLGKAVEEMVRKEIAINNHKEMKE